MSVPVEALYPDLMKMTLKESHCDTGSTWSPGQREDIQRIERGQREDRERTGGENRRTHQNVNTGNRFMTVTDNREK